MEYQETKLKDCYIITPAVFRDERGYFFESYSRREFEMQTGMNGNFVQDNQSFSTYGVVRGLHFQKGDSVQAKLVRVLAGRILDVAVDLRKDSDTYGQYVAVPLSADNQQQLYVPRGFAHGFSVLSETAVFAYKCDNYYDKAAEGGIRLDDDDLHIDWQLPADRIISSAKDKEHPFLKDLNSPF